MSYEAAEQEMFDMFGEAEPHEIELAANENSILEPLSPPPIKTGFSWTAFCGGLAALVWIGGAIALPVSIYGLNGLMQMEPVMQAGLVALAFGPALLFWLGSAAAGEALKARKLAVEITRMTQLQQMPLELGENHAQRLTMTVKYEIEQLNDAVASALYRLAELEAVAQRNAAMFDSAVSATRENVHVMTDQLVREREALMELNNDLRGQTETMSNAIGRQVRLMREASKLVKTEIGAAEDALETHLAAFTASATVMGERTAAFHHAADSAAASASSLNTTMHSMLDGLGEATKLTDAARQSAEQAVLAANETANSVRETTRSAVFEAKRAAQLVRAETAALQDAASETLARLKDAADAARAASEESQAAADRHATSIEKRLAALASTAGATRKVALAQAKAEARIEREPVQPAVTSDLYAAANVARTSRPVEKTQEPQRSRGFKGFGGWGGFMPPRVEETQVKPAPTPERADAFDLVEFKPERKDPDVELKNDAMDLLASAGVDISDALLPADLEKIAQAARHGAAARRRAVAEAAPTAINRILRHVSRSSDAGLVAKEFRSRPDLAKSEKKGEGSDLVRAYLLIDAALG